MKQFSFLIACLLLISTLSAIERPIEKFAILYSGSVMGEIEPCG